MSLVNKAQFLLINEASVEWLRGEICDREFFEDLETTIQRFRGNFVVKFNKAFEENEYSEFAFDDTLFEVIPNRYFYCCFRFNFSLEVYVQGAK